MVAKRRIGIDLHVASGIYQGSRTHALELFARVIRLSPEYEFYIFLYDRNAIKGISDAYGMNNVHIVEVPYANAVKRYIWQLPQFQRRYKLDLLHTQYVVPIPSFSACVVTIHDILFEDYPEYFEPLFILRSRILMRYAAQNSAHVFTVSEYSKSKIQEKYGVSSERISVIYNAINHSRFTPQEKGIEAISKYGLKPKQ